MPTGFKIYIQEANKDCSIHPHRGDVEGSWRSYEAAQRRAKEDLVVESDRWKREITEGGLRVFEIRAHDPYDARVILSIQEVELESDEEETKPQVASASTSEASNTFFESLVTSATRMLHPRG